MNLPPRAEWRRLYRHWFSDPLAGARLNAAHRALRWMPTDAISALGGRLGRLLGPRFHPVADRRARAALAALRPDLASDDTALQDATGRLWDGIGRTYAEFSAEDRLWPEGRVAVEGQEHVQEAKARGQGLIVAGVHLGNWEVIPIALGYLGQPHVHVYQPPRNRFEHRIALQSRLRTAARICATVPEAQGLRLDEAFELLLPSPSVGAKLVRALQAGRAVVLNVDESVRGRVHGPRLGRPPGPDGNLGRIVRLARLTGAAVVPAYVLRTRGARFTVHFLPPLALQRTGDRASDLGHGIAALDAAVTGPVLANLDQWYMLLDFRLDR